MAGGGGRARRGVRPGRRGGAADDRSFSVVAGLSSISAAFHAQVRVVMRHRRLSRRNLRTSGSFRANVNKWSRVDVGMGPSGSHPHGFLVCPGLSTASPQGGWGSPAQTPNRWAGRARVRRAAVSTRRQVGDVDVGCAPGPEKENKPVPPPSPRSSPLAPPPPPPPSRRARPPPPPLPAPPEGPHSDPARRVGRRCEEVRICGRVRRGSTGPLVRHLGGGCMSGSVGVLVFVGRGVGGWVVGLGGVGWGSWGGWGLWGIPARPHQLPFAPPKAPPIRGIFTAGTF
jgi:hypothetical protein